MIPIDQIIAADTFLFLPPVELTIPNLLIFRFAVKSELFVHLVQSCKLLFNISFQSRDLIFLFIKGIKLL
ncbi:hypothetical protein QFZ77_001368 [Paenibacillus sp. V4I3]|nr:hypothetical protein [Paenibacillus sp. V4I3]MDQ0891407.1 hypothetical protein [Paenibacillus sp. V4I9]